MADDNAAKGQEAGGEGGGAATEQKGADAGQDQGGQDKQGAEDKSKGGEGGDAGADKGDAEGDDKKPAPDDGAEPQTRKRMTAKDHIIARKERQLEKARKGDGGKPKPDAADKGDEDLDADDDEINPEDRDLISKVVDEKLAPVLQERQAAQDDAEVKDFLASNPEFKPYEAKVRRYMQHPSRANLPVASVFYEVAGPDLMKLGAKRAQAANAEAAKGTAGGGSSRTVEGEKPISEMTDDEFRTKQEAVRRTIGN